ncbi:MAG: hypothetical protein M3P95_12535, partial [Actinomycetota bacterium]|nr:hypothetical protein [Actinomycetota bacterium]
MRETRRLQEVHDERSQEGHDGSPVRVTGREEVGPQAPRYLQQRAPRVPGAPAARHVGAEQADRPGQGGERVPHAGQGAASLD